MKTTICGHASLLIVRGVCKPCYKTMRKLIKAGKTTWEILVIEGKCSSTITPSQHPMYKKQHDMFRISKTKGKKKA